MIKRIKQTTVVSAGLVAYLMFASVASAQNTSKAAPKALIPLKVDVVFSEYEGAKKVSSLPYTLAVNANERNRNQHASLRVGQRFPVWNGQDQFFYNDIGTDLDCSAESQESGRYRISLVVQRTSLSSTIMVPFLPSPPQPVAGLPRPGGPPKQRIKVPPSTAVPEPVYDSFRTSLDLLMRDGQTIQGVMATDPVSGRVLKVDVTLHVVKEQ